MNKIVVIQELCVEGIPSLERYSHASGGADYRIDETGVVLHQASWGIPYFLSKDPNTVLTCSCGGEEKGVLFSEYN